jgi:hypothetical protein
LLAFLGAGHTPKHGKYKDTVRRGVQFLKDNQNADGSLGGEGGTALDLRAHAVCTKALADAFGYGGKDPLFAGTVLKAVEYLASAQTPGAGWGAKKGSPCDTVTTGWAVYALFLAKISGLNIPPDSFDAARKWFNAMTDVTTYRVAFAAVGDGGADKEFASANALTATAAATIGRIIIQGNTRVNTPELQGGGKLLKQSPPKWDVQAGTVDVEYWYFGTLAMFQLGRDYWKTWNESMRNALVPSQRLSTGSSRTRSGKCEACADGSWDPVGARGARKGRVFTTALNTLTLEMFYHYPRLGVR